MKQAWWIGLSVLLWALPAVGSANVIEDVRVSSDEQDVIVVLQTSGPAKTPTLRSARGMIRLWVEDAAQQTSLKQRVDSAALSYIEVRPGTSNTAAVRIRLTNRKLVPISDVRVSQARNEISVRVARSLLERLAPSAQTANKIAEKSAPAPAVPVAESASAAATQEPVVEAKHPPSAVFEKPPKPLDKTALAPDTSASTSALLGATALLGLIYLAMRMLQKKRPQHKESPIEIIASKRLGPRHQLLIVRAFGRDHLLSVQGGTTTRIAGAKAGQMLGADDTLSAGTFDFDTEPKTTPEQPAFGRDFLRLAIGQRLREEAKQESAPANPPSRDSSSDAISGLMRLRREAGL